MDFAGFSIFIIPEFMEMTCTMAFDPVVVKFKDRVPKKRGRGRLWLFTAIAVMFAAAAGTWGFSAFSHRSANFGPQFEVISNGTGKIIRVPSGGDLQAAIDGANAGDIIELQAGATYFGEIMLPNKPLTDFVTVRSSAFANLPEGKRVTPAQTSSLAKILSRTAGKPALSAADGANHYRFIGIEFSSSITKYNYALISFGSGEKSASRVPHDLEIDRCYIHPLKDGIVRRGIALNSASTTIQNSYIEGFAFPGEETQGIAGWTGTRDVHIINNYIEGGAENILIGGNDPASPEVSPTNIEIRRNHINKPAEWVGKATLKTLFELKNAKHVQLTDNLLTNNWVGSAFRLTVRNQDGTAPYSTIEDVLIQGNVIDGGGEGINILGKDNLQASGTLKGLMIKNNLLMNIGPGHGFDGSGYFLQINDGEDITVVNNTSFNAGNIVTFYGEMPRRFVFRDNITGHGNYGIHGLDVRSPESLAMFPRNVFINLNRVTRDGWAFPRGNAIVPGSEDVGFVNLQGHDYRLSPASRYRGKALGGKDLGCTLSMKDLEPYR